MKYDAFISYSHAADGLLAPALQVALHKLAKPWFKIRALRVFRDETDLTVSPGTWHSIRDALADSEYFLLLASPTAAASKWVGKEISFWLENRSLDRLAIVLTDGELVWSDELAGFDPNRTTSIPARLAEAYREEPLYADLRFARESVDLSPENPEFKRHVLPIAARLHGKTPAELVSDEVREHRRTVRIRNTAIAALATLTALAGGAAYLASIQADEAERQRVLAVEARDEAERKQLRAEGAELRALLQRLDELIRQSTDSGDGLARLQAERAELEAKLKRVSTEHQSRLARAIDFRGDLGFLMRWEGHAGGVRNFGTGVFIDPATDLSTADAKVIRDRYAFLLTPYELQAVLAVVGLRGGDAQTALEADPVLQRIRLGPADVARLVPEVAAPMWRRLVERFPVLVKATTPPEVQTAVLSAAFSMGPYRVGRELSEELTNGNWPGVADGIEGFADTPVARRFKGLTKRRREEAALIRNALSPATSQQTREEVGTGPVSQ